MGVRVHRAPHGERLAAEPLLGGAVPVLRGELRQIGEALGDLPVLPSPEGGAERQGAFVRRARCGELPQPGLRLGEPAQRPRDVRVGLPALALGRGDRALELGPGGERVAGIEQHPGEGVARHRLAREAGLAEDLLIDAQGLLESRPGLGVTALVVQHLGEVHQADRRAGAAGAEGRDEEVPRPAVRPFGPLPVLEALQSDPEVAGRLGEVDRRAGTQAREPRDLLLEGAAGASEVPLRPQEVGVSAQRAEREEVAGSQGSSLDGERVLEEQARLGVAALAASDPGERAPGPRGRRVRATTQPLEVGDGRLHQPGRLRDFAQREPDVGELDGELRPQLGLLLEAASDLGAALLQQLAGVDRARALERARRFEDAAQQGGDPLGARRLAARELGHLARAVALLAGDPGLPEREHGPARQPERGQRGCPQRDAVPASELAQAVAAPSPARRNRPAGEPVAQVVGESRRRGVAALGLGAQGLERDGVEISGQLPPAHPGAGLGGGRRRVARRGRRRLGLA